MRISFLFRFVMTLLLTICGVFVLLINASNSLKTHYCEVAQIETERITTLVVAKTIHEEIANFSKDDFINSQIDQKMSYNVELINRLLSYSAKAIYKNLKEVENGISPLFDEEITSNYPQKGIIYEIPFSLIMNNLFLNNLGSKIPVKFSLLGSVETNCVSNVQSFGINNALVSLEVVCKVEAQVLLPLMANEYEYTISIPFSMTLIEGQVPSYYLGTHTVEGVTKGVGEVYEI